MSSKNIFQSKMDLNMQLKVVQLTKTKFSNFYTNLCIELKEFSNFFTQESSFTISKKMIQIYLKTFYKKVIHKIQKVIKRMVDCCQKDKELKIMNEFRIKKASI